MDWQALGLSLRIASLTTLFLFFIGLPLAYGLSRRPGRISSLVEALTSLPLVLPPTVLGFYLLLTFSKINLAFSFWGLVLASIIYSLPFALQPFLAAFQAIDPQLLEASWSLGESKLRTFARVAVPLARGGIISGAILAFAHTLGEFGVVLMVGGNIPGISRTLSVSIYGAVEALDYQAAHTTAAFLLLVSLAALVSTSLLRNRTAIKT